MMRLANCWSHTCASTRTIFFWYHSFLKELSGQVIRTGMGKVVNIPTGVPSPNFPEERLDISNT